MLPCAANFRLCCCLITKHTGPFYPGFQRNVKLVGEPEIQKWKKSGRKVAEF